MKKHSYIGLDVHKESISIALAEAGRCEKKSFHQHSSFLLEKSNSTVARYSKLLHRK
jgi:hypothetical protein